MKFVKFLTFVLLFAKVFPSASADGLTQADGVAVETADTHMAAFRAFSESRRENREASIDFKIISLFVKSAIGRDHCPSTVSFSQIEPMISKQFGSSSMPSERILTVNFDLLAEIVKIHAYLPVTASRIRGYLAQYKQRIEEARKYYLLKSFACSKLNIDRPTLDSMDLWFLEMPTADIDAPVPDLGIPSFLKGSFCTVLKLVSSKAGRDDVTNEFEAFVAENAEKQSRIELCQDLRAYQMERMSTAVSSGPALTTVMETVYSAAMIQGTPYEAIAPSYDLRAYFDGYKKK